MTTLLLVEDNLHKREKVNSFLSDLFPDLHMSIVESYTSACRAVLAAPFDIIVMDMSLPTYDKSTQESGGRFRTFGGREVARKVVRRALSSRIVFLTQYPAFRDELESHTLDSLQDELKKECGANFLGLVHYDSSSSGWRDQLGRLVASAL